MGLRFRRSVRLFPGVRLNFSGSGISTSIGGRGAHVTYGHGHVRTTVGIPGTGVSYTSVSRHAPGRPHTSSNTGCLPVVIVGVVFWVLVASVAHHGRQQTVATGSSASTAAPSAAPMAQPPPPPARLIIPLETHEQYVVDVNALNQRNGPDGEVVGTLHRGALIDVFEISNGWARISSAGNPARWVSARLLCKGDSCASRVTMRNADSR